MLSITLFVDDNAAVGGDGLDWGTAYNDLQAALTQAAVLKADNDSTNDVASIWIAEGTYYPSVELDAGDTRSASFSLLDGVDLYGGFAGTEMTFAERDLSAGHTTILSGDLGILEDETDNAYTVVYCSENTTATLDGLSITDGKSHRDDELVHGGGIRNFGILTINQSKIAGNSAKRGGGIYNEDGYLKLTDVEVVNNLAINDWHYTTLDMYDCNGGGISNNGGTLIVIDSIIYGNSADHPDSLGVGTSRGGGIYNKDGNLTIINSTFSNNTASFLCGGDGGNGGGVYNTGNMAVTDSEFISNSSIYDTGDTENLGCGGGGCGGGIWNAGELTITNSTFSDNSAKRIGLDIWFTSTSQYYGGNGACVHNRGSMTIMNSSMIGNSAEDGGAIFNYFGQATIQNSVITNNSATFCGGGIVNYAFDYENYYKTDTASMTIIDSSLHGNVAYESGGAILNYAAGPGYHEGNNFAIMTIANSLLYNNTANESGGAIINDAHGSIYHDDDIFATIDIVNSLFHDNVANESGRTISNNINDDDSFATITITNSTIADIPLTASNSSIILNQDSVMLHNSILWRYNGNEITGPGTLIEENSLIGEDPKFISELDRDYHLQADSPAIDAGNNDLLPDGTVTDLDGHYRTANGIVDIGAYEFGSTLPLSGDANYDGVIDASDFTILAGNWQAGVDNEQTTTWSTGDFNHDGKIDASDLTILAGNWQAGTNTTVVATSGEEPATEPEPERVIQFAPPPKMTFRATQVLQRSSLPPRRYIPPTSQSTDTVLAESTWSKNEFTAIAKDLASASTKKMNSASEKLFALGLDPYADLE